MNLKTFARRARGLDIVTDPPVPVDSSGLPHLPCPLCKRSSFHMEPSHSWRCSTCSAPLLLSDASGLTGWNFCSLPGDPEP